MAKIDKKVQFNLGWNKEEAVIKQFFKAGVSMACWSMGKLTEDGDEAKLTQFADQLYSEFVATLKHKKEK